MNATLIEPGLVRVMPDNEITAEDILELGEHLIDVYGHRKGDSGGQSTGFSIHGAIGEAARRATNSSDKGDNTARPLREEAAKLIEDTHGKTEIELNDDQAVDAAEAIALMRAARERTAA